MRLNGFTSLLLASLVMAPLLASCIATRSGTSDVSSTAASAQEALLDALGVFGGQRVRGEVAGPAVALAGLEEHDDAEDPSERDMIAALIPIMTRLTDGKSTPSPADYRTVKDMMSRMASKHPGDFEIQYAMTTGMAAVEIALKDAGADDDTASKTRARALATKFPSQAKAHAHLGQVLAAIGDEEGALESYARCLKLDPGVAACKSELKQLADRYRRPRCTSVAAKRFGLHAAYAANATTAKHGRKGLRPITVDKRQLLMETKPALDGKAVEEAEVGTDTKRNEIILTLTPLATAKLSEITAALAERQGFLAIVVDGKVKGAPQVMSTIESRTLTALDIPLEKLCAKMERRTLPVGIAAFL